ncbi:MAG: trigger factor [Acidobacteriota bacterium]|nr:trigger factor [Acidobacteriota bacterium]
MSVVVSVEDVGACQMRVTVAVPFAAVQAETERVTQEFRRRARLPGFRKGKIPLEIVKKRFGEEIEQDVVDRLLPRYWKQAEAEASLDPLLSPQVDDVDLKPGEDLTFVATVDVRPTIELGELGEFDLPDTDTLPKDEEIAEALEDLQRNLADWKDADRPATRGDLVVAQLRQLLEGEEAEAPVPTTFEVGDERAWEELTIAATGMAAGQRAEFERRSGESEITRYSIDVERVRERELAPLDDGFAASVGDFDSLDALRREVADRLRASKERQRRRDRETALLDQLCERYPFELPKRVVDKEVEQILSEYASSLAAQGVDLDRADVDWQRLAAEVRPRAERRVRARLLIDEVAETRSVSVEEDEFESALANMARAQNTPSGALRRDLDRAGRLAELRDQLRREKALRGLLGEDGEDEKQSES